MTTTRRTTTTKRKKTGGRPLLQSQAFEKAVKSYEEALASFRKGDYGKAIRLFEAVVQNFGAEKEISDRARMWLSVAESRSKGPAPAPSDPEGLYYRGVIAANEGNLDEAADMLGKVVSKEPGNARALYAMATVRAARGDVAGACEYLARAIDIDGSNRVYAMNDDDFETVREDEQFLALIGRGPEGDA